VRFTPVDAGGLPGTLAELLIERHGGERPLRVAFDGPRFANLSLLASAVGSHLETAGRPAALIDAQTFYRDAALRFEYGKTDVESFYTGWLDTAALNREVLVPVAGSGRYLPSLRDPVTNRSTRAEPVSLAPQGILILNGELLLGIGLAVDATLYASVSRPARRRLTRQEWAWTLPAFDRYDIDVDPSSVADVVLRYDDPRRPAIFIR
jgi:hypothetical protein